MFYALRGRVTAARSLTCLSKEVEGYLSLYKAKEQPPQISNTTNNAEFGQAMPEPELGPLVGRMLAREPLDSSGEFHIRIDGRQHPDAGKQLLVVLQIQRLGGQESQERSYKTLYCVLGPWQANWRPEGQQMAADADFHLPSEALGQIRQELGIWNLRLHIEGLKEAKIELHGAQVEFNALEDSYQATLVQQDPPSEDALILDLLIDGNPAAGLGWSLEMSDFDNRLNSIDFRLKKINSQ
jgi:hypothetical protein